MNKKRDGAVYLASSLFWLAMGCQRGLVPESNPFASLAQEKNAASPRAIGATAAAGDASPQKAQPAATIQGNIEVAARLKEQAKPNDTIYVMARDAASQRIVAVTRLFVPQDPKLWPLHFVLKDNRLLRELPVTLSVRIDKDGDATTKQPGDLIGQMAHEVVAPLQEVRLLVDQSL